MLAPLEAEDQLIAIDSLAAGTGHMRKFDLEAFMRELRAQAHVGQAPAQATPQSLARMGIEHVVGDG